MIFFITLIILAITTPLVESATGQDFDSIFLDPNKGNATLEDIAMHCPNFRPEQMTPTFENWVDLYLVLTPYHFIDIDNAVEKMSFSGLISLQWEAPCLHGDRLELNDKNTRLNPVPTSFWKPSILFLQSQEMFLLGADRRDTLEVSVRPASLDQPLPEFIWQWSIMGVYTFHCDLNLILFPADVQTCVFRLQTKEQMQVYQFSDCLISYQDEQMKFTMENSNWRLLNMSCQIKPGYALSSMLTISFKMARISRFFMIHLVAPCIMLIFLELCSFALPAKGADRTTYTMTIYLAFIFVESMLFTILPQTPKLILLSEHVVFQSAFSTVITVYSAVVCKLAKYFSKKIAVIQKRKIRLLILIDFVAFLISVLAFVIEIGRIIYQYNVNYVEAIEEAIISEITSTAL